MMKFENVTIYTNGGFGITRTDVKSVALETIKYAQYDRALKVTALEPRKRKARSWVLTYAPFLVIVARADAFDPESAFTAPETSSTGAIVQRGRYSSCDSRWTSDFIAQLEARGVTPLFVANALDSHVA